MVVPDITDLELEKLLEIAIDYLVGCGLAALIGETHRVLLGFVA